MNQLINLLKSDIGLQLFAAVISLFAAISSLLIRNKVDKEINHLFPFLRKVFKLKEREVPKSYKEQMSKLTKSLIQASTSVDKILLEITEVRQEREMAVNEIEKN